MDRKKITIIVLIILGILFVVGQGGGFMRDDKSDKKPSAARQKEISQEQSGWTSAIKNSLGWMNLLEEIEVSRISKWSVSPSNGKNCSGVLVDGEVVLTMGAANCELSTTIARADEEQELKLRVTEGCEKSRDFARLHRISPVIVAQPHSVQGRVIVAKPNAGTPAESSDIKTWPKLNITYQPTDGKVVSMEDPWTCGSDPVSLIVVPKGGRLTLKCAQCSKKHQLMLSIE